MGISPFLIIAGIQAATKLIGQLSALPPPAPVAPKGPKGEAAPKAVGPLADAARRSVKFDDVLRAELRGGRPREADPLTFGPGASQNLLSKGLRISQEQYDRLVQGVEEAAQRGGRRSLILMDGYAFLVDVNERKVLEIAESSQLGAATFAQIDSVVEARRT